MIVDQKYELTNQDSKTGLYRIRAVRDFGNVKAGDLGGWVSNMYNLLHNGNCWVADEAKAYDGSIVRGDAFIGDSAEVFNKAIISGRSKVLNQSKVFGYANVKDDAEIRDRALVSGQSTIADFAVIRDWAQVYENSHVGLYGQVSGSALLYGFAKVDGHQKVRYGKLATDITNEKNIAKSLACQLGMKFNHRNDVECYLIALRPGLIDRYNPQIRYDVGQYMFAEGRIGVEWIQYPEIHNMFQLSYKSYWKDLVNENMVVIKCLVNKRDIISIQSDRIFAKRIFVEKICID